MSRARTAVTAAAALAVTAAAASARYPGQCIHRWHTTQAVPRREACLDCSATCTRDRAGLIESYDAGVRFSERRPDWATHERNPEREDVTA